MAVGASRSRTALGRFALGRPRLVSSVLIAIVSYLVAPHSWMSTTRLLLAWNLGAGIYIVLILVAFSGATTKTIRWRASQTDEGQFVILVLISLAGIASMGAILVQLASIKDLHGIDKGLHLGLAAATILSAWMFIHLSFALHYANEYFDQAKTLDGEKAELRGGVTFPGTDEPDYWDFMYFAFIIGVAAQTADVSITSKRIRRTSLGHSVLAFFFNSAVLALTINIAAGLV